MIVYVFNDNFFKKIFLPVIISGVYQICDDKNLFLGNIEEKDGIWVLKFGKNIGNGRFDEIKLKIYDNIVVNNNLTNEKYYIYTLPIDETSTLNYLVKSDEFTFGYINCDINYANDYAKDVLVKFSYADNKWKMETNSENIFVMDERCKKSFLLIGDYVFIYGVKIFLIDFWL